MRTMTKGQLVDNIVAAWNKITPDMIRKSFEICGQVPNFDPERVLCMREGNSCHDVLPKLKELLKYPSNQLDLEKLEPVPVGEGVVVNMVEQEEQQEEEQDEEEKQDPLV